MPDPWTDLRWRDLPAGDLTARQLHDLLALRSAVFVVEQDCAYQDIDGQDLIAGTRHLWADGPDGIAAYARLLAPDEGGRARIGRVIVASSARGTGLGHVLLDRSLDSCRSAWPQAGIMLAAQAHLQGYYAAHGFVPVGDAETYLEDGIPHVDMLHDGPGHHCEV